MVKGSALAALLVVATLVFGPAARHAAAASCTGSTGPGIPPPASLPSGLPGFHAQWYGQSGYPTLFPGHRSTATDTHYYAWSLRWDLCVIVHYAYLNTWVSDTWPH